MVHHRRGTLDIDPVADHNAKTPLLGRLRVSTPSDHSRPLAYRFVITILRPLLVLLTKRDWAGEQNLPEGGYVAVTNHYSYLEPFVFGLFLVDHGHTPHYLGKIEVFKNPVIGAILRAAEQIPVRRESGRAIDAYRSAVEAVRGGRCVAIYPEGTLTRDPGLWPMRGKTGAARVALETGCPVIPITTWGAADILDRGDGPDHGSPHRSARGDPRRACTCNPLRPDRTRHHFHRQTQTSQGGLRTSAAVYGTGSWGTAFAAVLADAGTDVTMWGRRQEVVDQINGGVNQDYLPELRLPERIRATSDPFEASAGADIVVLAVPSQTLRANLTTWGGALPQSAAVVSLMKGVELGTTKRMSEVISEVGRVEQERIVVVSGPNLAREIAAKQPAASVVAAGSEAMAERVAAACAAPYFRPYTRSATRSSCGCRAPTSSAPRSPGP